jgi:hypothetical protein
MKGGATTALAIGVGYVLGRRRKMRLATMLAVGAATGGLAKLGPLALRQGAKYLDKTDIAGTLGPQVGEIVDTLRGDLLDAGKAAAAAAVTSRIDSLSENLHDRAETLRNPEAVVDDATETVGKVGEGTVGKVRRRGRAAGTDDDAEQDGEERRNGRSRRERSRPSRSARSEPDEAEPEDEYDEYEDEQSDEDERDESPADEADDFDEEDAEKPAPRRRSTSRSPVTRTRR